MTLPGFNFARAKYHAVTLSVAQIATFSCVNFILLKNRLSHFRLELCVTTRRNKFDINGLTKSIRKFTSLFAVTSEICFEEYLLCCVECVSSSSSR